MKALWNVKCTSEGEESREITELLSCQFTLRGSWAKYSSSTHRGGGQGQCGSRPQYSTWQFPENSPEPCDETIFKGSEENSNMVTSKGEDNELG